MAHSVGQRANEIAIRRALGAQSLNVLGLAHSGTADDDCRRPRRRSGRVLGDARHTQLWGVTITDPLTLALVVLGWRLWHRWSATLRSAALKVAPIAALRGD